LAPLCDGKVRAIAISKTKLIDKPIRSSIRVLLFESLEINIEDSSPVTKP